MVIVNKRAVHKRLNPSWKIGSSAVDGQSFFVIDGSLLNLLTVYNPSSLFIIFSNPRKFHLFCDYNSKISFHGFLSFTSSLSLLTFRIFSWLKREDSLGRRVYLFFCLNYYVSLSLGSIFCTSQRKRKG